MCCEKKRGAIAIEQSGLTFPLGMRAELEKRAGRRQEGVKQPRASAKGQEFLPIGALGARS